MKRLFLEFVESIHIAVEQLNANKTRAMLTTLGVIIGVLAVTMMGTAVNGIDKGVRDTLDVIGSDVFFVARHKWEEADDAWRRLKNRPAIRDNEAKRINEIIAETEDSQLYRAAPDVRWWPQGDVKTKERSVRNVHTLGTDENFEFVNNSEIEEGRFLTEIECDSGRAVTVLGYDVADALFPDESAVGKMVRIKGREVEVVGVFASMGSFFGLMSYDNFAVVPIRWLRKHYTWEMHTMIRVKLAPDADREEARYELVGAMRRIHRQVAEEEDNFAINSTDQMEEGMNTIKYVLAIAVLGITGLSLFVSAIGIMNITFVSVKERTREIGTRRAVGARRSSIIIQFLTEAVAVCLVGGAIGLGAAYFGKLIIEEVYPDFPFVYSMNLIVTGMVASVTVGVLSGIIPAFMASRLDPATALRHE